MAYGTGPLPPNSYFDKMTIEIQAWRKEPGSAPVAATVQAVAQPIYSPPPVAAAPTYSPPPQVAAPVTPQFAPPPVARPPVQQPPQPSMPTYGGGMTPLKPPPIQSPPPRRQDDDPFGGTGDFTPVS